MRRVQQIFSFSLKVGLVLVALGEAVLIYLSDFSGYMFDDDVKKLGLGAFLSGYHLLHAAVRNRPRYTFPTKLFHRLVR